MSGTGGVVTAADIAAFADRHGVPLPDAEPLAGSTRQFLDSLPTTNYFGFGVLPPTYARHDWR